MDEKNLPRESKIQGEAVVLADEKNHLSTCLVGSIFNLFETHNTRSFDRAPLVFCSSTLASLALLHEIRRKVLQDKGIYDCRENIRHLADIQCFDDSMILTWLFCKYIPLQSHSLVIYIIGSRNFRLEFFILFQNRNKNG